MIEVGTRVRTNDKADHDCQGLEGWVSSHSEGEEGRWYYLKFDGIEYYDYKDDNEQPAYYCTASEFEVIEGVPTEDEQDEPLEEWEKELLNPNTTAEDVLDGMTKIAPQHETVQADISPEREERIDRNQQRDADTARIYRLIDALGDVSVRNWELVTNNEDTIFLNVTFKRH